MNFYKEVAPNRTVAAGFSLRGKDAPVKGAATGKSVLLGALTFLCGSVVNCRFGDGRDPPAKTYENTKLVVAPLA